MRKQHGIFIIIFLLTTLAGCSDMTENPQQADKAQTTVYSNPIDEYFLPHIDNATVEAERREYQDTYRGVWKSEFDNIINVISEKFVHQEDKDKLVEYRKSVFQLIDTTYDVVMTDWQSDNDYDYDLPKDGNSIPSGTGIRSELNQIETEIYRNAAINQIDDEYGFLDIDYSAQHYE